VATYRNENCWTHIDKNTNRGRKSIGNMFALLKSERDTRDLLTRKACASTAKVTTSAKTF